MKKLLFTFLLCMSFCVFSQTTQKPLYIADGIIGSEYMFNADKANIKSLDVYKSSSNFPAAYKSYEGIATKGLVSVKVKENYYDIISLARLNRQVGLAENSPAYVDGNLISNTETLVFGNILENYAVKDVSGKKMLVIDSTPPKQN